MSRADALDRLIATELQANLSAVLIGREIRVVEETGSTNDAILQNATPDSKEGLVLFAEHQTAGRGQRGNRWESSAGKGLWFSILLRPKIDISNSHRLTAWAAEAVSETIRNEFSLETEVKLPNDIQIHGRKVAGVLVEMRAQEKAPHLSVVGIGINVNQSSEDFSEELRKRAISLAMTLHRQVDRQRFATALLRNLDQSYTALLNSLPPSPAATRDTHAGKSPRV